MDHELHSDEVTLVRRLRNGDHLALLGDADDDLLSALAALHREAADEIERLRDLVQAKGCTLCDPEKRAEYIKVDRDLLFGWSGND